ncbi:MAG: pyridoxine 5'-phosphate synthase [Candidatus Omnitrophica bacterium]|nr:pyridoxine 5'-phosphate synthase [Candidatus Omnitrophota bacterium]
MPLLGVNIDHVATIRQQRREFDPDPVKAALICQEAGADSIVAHLREDRRHINDKDIVSLKKALQIRFNMEMSIAPDVVQLACKIVPDQVTLVPERRQELTTEGGLDVVGGFKKLKPVCTRLRDKGIAVSLFVDAQKAQVDAAKSLGVSIIELHTGSYAEAKTRKALFFQLKTLTHIAQYAHSLGIEVNAGHGLKYHNTSAVAAIPAMNELNIGHSIISYAVFVGLKRAVTEMRAISRLKSSTRTG